MEHKDIWLVLGLTVVLAVAVSLSTVSLTGDATWWGKGKSMSLPSCIFIDNNPPTSLFKKGMGAKDACRIYGQEYTPIFYEMDTVTYNYETEDGTCGGQRTEEQHKNTFGFDPMQITNVALWMEVTPEAEKNRCIQNNDNIKDHKYTLYNMGVLCCKK